VNELPENWQLTLAAWLTSTFLGVAGIAVSLGNRNQRVWLTAVCVVLGIISIVLFIVALRKSLGLLRRSPLGSNHLTRIRVGVHTSRWATSGRDVYDAHAFFRSLLPPKQDLDLVLLQQLHKQNHRTIRLIEVESGARRQIVGLAILVPLTRKALQALEAKTLVSNYDVRLEEHVTKTWRRPSGVYIGGIAGSTPSGRAWALSFTEFLVAQTGVKNIYARPASPDGLRVMKMSGFSPIGAPSQFWHSERNLVDDSSEEFEHRLVT
jgi:hypothetical protein